MHGSTTKKKPKSLFNKLWKIRYIVAVSSYFMTPVTLLMFHKYKYFSNKISEIFYFITTCSIQVASKQLNNKK